MRFTALWLAFIAFSGCQTGKKFPPAVAESDRSALSLENVETVVIMGLNDFHGNLLPIERKTKKGRTYSMGGAAYLASHVNKLKRRYEKNLLILDAGDQWQGTLDSNIDEGATVVRFFNQIGVNAATLGNHEFDYGPVGPEGSKGDPLGALKARLKEANFPFVVSNVWEKASGARAALPNTVPNKIFQVGKLKLGVVGVSTPTTPTRTRGDYVEALRFEPMDRAVLRESQALRARGAHLVVLLAHEGLECQALTPEYRPARVKSARTLQGGCGKNGPIVQLLKTLPKGTLDAVIAGHTHRIVHHWVQGVPVVQGGAAGLYYNLVYLTYDLKQKKVLPQFARIDGPIPVCKKVFSNQGNCNGAQEEPPEGRGALVTPRLFGRSIYQDRDAVNLLQNSLAKNEAARTRVVGHAARTITHDARGESEMANLVADALRASVDADVAIINPGSIRTTLNEGPISYQQLYRALPYDNHVSLLRVSGTELRNLIKVATCGARGFFGFSGLKLTLIDLPYRARSRDLNKDGRISHWEVNRLVRTRLANGKRIRANKFYTVATTDYLVRGGDDMAWAMDRIPQSRKSHQSGVLMRDAVIRFLQLKPSVNTLAEPLVMADARRIQLVKARYPRHRWKSRKRRAKR